MGARLLSWSVRGTLVALAVCIGLFALVRFVIYPPFSDLRDIAHAGGIAEGERYTNSLATIELSRAMGFTQFEIDIVATSDGELVCGHNWKVFDGVAPDLQEFLAWRQELAYPPCTLAELVDWFELNEDMILVSDTKETGIEAELALHARLGERLFVQAYAPEDVCEFVANGIGNIIYATYQREDTLTQLWDDLTHPCIAENDLVAMTIPMRRVLRGYGLAARAISGLPVYAHTIDSCERSLRARLLGADAFFTEGLLPGEC